MCVRATPVVDAQASKLIIRASSSRRDTIDWMDVHVRLHAHILNQAISDGSCIVHVNA